MSRATRESDRAPLTAPRPAGAVSRSAGLPALVLLGLAALALPAAARAQAPAGRPARAEPRPTAPAADTVRRRSPPPPPSSDYWQFYLLPYPSYNALEGLGLWLTGGWSKAALPGPVPTGISIQPLAQISTSGTRGIQLTFDHSGRWPNWRLLLSVGSLREQRAPYFGMGNASLYEDSLEEDHGLPYYTYSLLRTSALGALRRRVVGPLHVQVGAQWRHYRARPLPRPRSRLADDLAAGVPLDTGSANGLELRAGLLLDTRDEEASPSRGIFLEALYARALRSAGDYEYSRYGVGFRQFVQLGEHTTLGLRQSVELTEGSIPFYVSSERMTIWRPEDGFGGTTTLRVNLPGRWTGPNKALASVDLRYKLRHFLPTPTTPVRVWLLVFADAGRVWDDGERFVARHLHTGYGVGTRLQVGRGGLFGLDIGWSPDAGMDFTTAVTFGF